MMAEVSLDLTDEKSALGQVMAWCRQQANGDPESVAIWRH